jgi:hypothetical protein
MHPNRITRRRIRFVMLALIVILGAFWAGARYGPRTPAAVEAVPASASTIATTPAPAAEPLGALEAENVHIYHQAAPAVANIVTKTVEYDFFYNAVPVEGAGSGFVIDPRKRENHRSNARRPNALQSHLHRRRPTQRHSPNQDRCPRKKANRVAVRRFAKPASRPKSFSHRQSLRLPIHANHRRSKRPRPHGTNQRHNFHRRSHPNRRRHQSRKFRRPANEFPRRSNRN